jgi:hypothetical protein
VQKCVHLVGTRVLPLAPLADCLVVSRTHDLHAWKAAQQHTLLNNNDEVTSEMHFNRWSRLLLHVCPGISWDTKR